MKKYLLIVLFLFSQVFSEEFVNESEVGVWKSYFGVEGGVGIYGIGNAFIAAINPTFFPSNTYLGVGYSLGILGGWQKYTYEKVGMRNTLGFAFSFVPNISSIQKGDYEKFELCIFRCKNQKVDFTEARGQNYDFYYALDGLFDFIKQDRNHFGTSLGFGLNLLGAGGQSGINDSDSLIGGFSATLSVRLGLYLQLQDDIFELLLKTPLIGVGAGNPTMMGDTLTLGYKKIF